MTLMLMLMMMMIINFDDRGDFFFQYEFLPLYIAKSVLHGYFYLFSL